jgi:hypothetical protein
MPLAIANDAFNVDSITLLEQLLGAFDWSKLSTIGYVQVLVWVLCAFIGVVFHFYVDYKKDKIKLALQKSYITLIKKVINGEIQL